MEVTTNFWELELCVCQNDVKQASAIERPISCCSTVIKTYCQMPQRVSNVPCLVCAFSASVTTGGTIYAFGIYGDALKKSLSLSQLQLDAISSTFFIAGLFAWVPGMVVDKFGMRFSMSLGGCSGCLCVVLYWLVSRSFIYLGNPVIVLGLLAVAICLSCGLIIGSIFKLTLLCGGPTTRGSAVGIAKGFVGLGAGVYATIFQAFRTQHESALDFLPVIAFFFILCSALPAFFLLPNKGQATPDNIQIDTTDAHFRTLYISLFALGTFIVGNSLWDILHQNNSVLLSGYDRDYAKIAFVLIIWLGPIVSLLYLPRKQRETLPTKVAVGETQPLVSKSITESNEKGDVQPAPVVEEGIPNLTLVQMLRTPSAWLMLWTCLILVGSGTYKTNNMGEMVESLGFPDTLTPATLAIFSVAQAAARICTGVFSEVALTLRIRSFGMDHGVPRPCFLVIACLVSVFSHLLLAASTGQVAFVIGCTISGIAFGMAWPLMVLIVGDVFGVKHHGANYMFYDGCTKAIGTIFLSQYVAGNVYEAHVDKEESGDEFLCVGAKCFRDTHLIVAGLSVTCMLASLAMQYMTRDVYSKHYGLLRT